MVNIKLNDLKSSKPTEEDIAEARLFVEKLAKVDLHDDTIGYDGNIQALVNLARYVIFKELEDDGE